MNGNKFNKSERELDVLLSSENQLMVRNSLRALAAEDPSMAWRSALNQKVLAEAARTKSRKRAWWILSPSISLAAVASLAFVLIVKPGMNQVHESTQPVQVIAHASIEDSLLNSHNDADTSADVTGTGLDAQETQTTSLDSDNGDVSADL